MRIVHTADWHLCDHLGRIDRTDDLHKRVERVAQICQEREADALLIAGDLFSDQASPEDMTRSLNHMRELFATFFDRGGIILALTGNHDRDWKINMVRAGATLAVPDAGRHGHLDGGRMYLLNGRALTTFSGADGYQVQFVLVPYPLACRYDITAGEYRTTEEQNRILHGRIAEWLQALPNKPTFKTHLPTVLAAHLHVRGSEMHSLYRLRECDDVLFDFADLNPGWAYVALGHIHKPQSINDQANVRYCGSLDRLDFGERHAEHGVLIVDIGKSGLVKEPERVPITATPFHEITIIDPEQELPTLTERFPDHEHAIVSVTVHSTTGTSRDEAIRQLRQIFPRWYELKWAEQPREHQPRVDRVFSPQADVASNVRRFLAEELTDDSDKDAILALAEEFLRAEAAQ